MDGIPSHFQAPPTATTIMSAPTTITVKSAFNIPAPKTPDAKLATIGSLQDGDCFYILQAKVIAKSDVRPFTNASGPNCLLSLTLLDSTGSRS